MNIQIDKFTINVNKESLINEVNRIDNEDSYHINETASDDTGEDFQITRGEDLEYEKKRMIEFIKSLDESTLVQLFNTKANITKKGEISKRGYSMVYNSGIITRYNNEYGSHSYDEVGLYFTGEGSNISLRFIERTYQESF